MAEIENAVEIPEQPKKSGKAGLFIVVAVVLVVALGAGGWWFFLRPSSAKGAEKEKPAHEGKEVKGTIKLENFVVNLADTESNAFLRLGLEIGLEKPVPKGEGKEEGGAPTAQLRDGVLAVLTSYRAADLLTPEGKKKLKEELVKTLKEKAPKLGVVDVYFTEFLVQR
ncbi:MAG: flagellar basal body-associated FliL family protein [Acidobacteria bacterium]|nr:flagellar basal body-associated FliL family protein [Acidobacteriota bacterium]MBI3663005.1 flagellar basal body-associated FliL family protein [Acidobacteriota bacterium]